MANDINDTNQNKDEDNFGLPDIEYKPLEQLEQKTDEPVNEELEQEPVAEPVIETDSGSYYEKPKYSAATNAYEDEEKSKAPLIIGVIILLVVIVGGILGWQFVYKPMKEKERQEQARLAKQKEAERIAKEKEEEERKRREAEAAAANVKPSIGTIETLSARTGRYYVIVSSAVDGDLVMDNARKMSAKGVSTKIIPPFGKWKFYRLAIGDYDSFASAQSSADASKAEYGPAAWVMKY
jgi:hypothetical protein